MTGNHVQDDLAPYALGELAGDELRLVKAHLELCAKCREELEQLVLTLGALAMAQAGAASPPPAVRQRLLKAIGPKGLQQTRPRFGWAPALAMALMTVAIIVIGMQNYSLRQRLQKAETRAATPESVADAARRLLLSPGAVRVTLRPASAAPEPEGRAIFVPRSTDLIFVANNLQPPPVGKAYQLWLLPVSGRPVPAGVFKPDARGEAAMVDPAIPAGLNAKGFAVTLEPEAGSPQPTSNILMVGTI